MESLSPAAWRLGHVVGLGAAVLCQLVAFRAALAWTAWADGKTDDLATPPLGEHESLVVRSEGDEASMFLTTMSSVNVAVTAVWTFFAWLIQQVWCGYRWVGRALWDRSLVVRGIVIVAFGVALYQAIIWQGLQDTWSMGYGPHPPPQSGLQQLAGAAVLLALAPLAVLAVVLAGVAALSIVVLSVLLVLFGADLVPAAGMLEVTVEASPPGKCDSFTSAEEPTAYRGSERMWLPFAHSAVYDRITCVHAVGEWIDKHL